MALPAIEDPQIFPRTTRWKISTIRRRMAEARDFRKYAGYYQPRGIEMLAFAEKRIKAGNWKH